MQKTLEAGATAAPRIARLKPSAILLMLAGAASLLFTIAQLFLLPLSHDELHFCHVAWLVQQGERPFADFLYHNTPGIVYLLRLYAAWNADFGAEIMVFGRALCVVSLVATGAMLVLLGAKLYRWQMGVLAATLMFPLMVMPYNPETFRKQHWSVRPEIIAMPLALLALFLTLRIAAANELKRPFLSGFLAAACAAVAVFVSPRFSFLCIGLVLVVVTNLGRIPRWTIAGMLVGAVIAPVLYLTTVGASDTQTWIVKYVAVVRGASDGRYYWFRMNIGKFVLVASSLQAAFFLWKAPSRSFRDLAIVQLVLMSATVLEPMPSFASWQMSMLLGSLLVSYLLVVLSEKQTAIATVAFVALLALWLYPGRGIVKNVRLLRHRELMLTSQVAASNAFGRALGPERGVFDPLNHPVVVRDLSYYWTQFAFVRRAIAQAGIDAPPIALVQECLRNPPAIISGDDLKNAAASDDERRTVEELLKSRYSQAASGYFVRNDMVERLTPVLLSCAHEPPEASAAAAE